MTVEYNSNAQVNAVGQSLTVVTDLIKLGCQLQENIQLQLFLTG